jgi:hypothetical protein
MRPEAEFRIRNLKRLERDTTYPDVVDIIARQMAKPEFRDCSELIVDYTGVGRPIIDMLRKKNLRPIAVTIHGGDRETQQGDAWNVPKRDIAHAAKLFLEYGKLTFSAAIPEKEVFKTELKNFKVKISASGHDSYEAEKSGQHDDLVLAVAMACWRAAKYVPWLLRVPKPPTTPKEWALAYPERLSRKLQQKAREAAR